MARAVTAAMLVMLCASLQAVSSVAYRGQEPVNPSSSVITTKPVGASLRVCLRLPDETLFLGKATVRLSGGDGGVLRGEVRELEGYLVFPSVAPGKYQVNVSATGYDDAEVNTQLETDHGERTLFVVLQPREMREVAEHSALAGKEAPDASPEKDSEPTPLVMKAEPGGAKGYWTPGELEDVLPPVDPSVACPTQDVLRGVGKRMTEFVSNLERFEATERVEHFAVHGDTVTGQPEVRKFDYMVSVSQNRVGTFLLEEYRNGLENSRAFPAHVATHGLPALALLFHPTIAGDFQFVCEGLGQRGGHAAWQVRFAQRTDRPVRMRAYVVNGTTYYEQLEGRAWVDPGSYQVLRLESEMAKAIPEIRLTQERIVIEYAPVQFRTQNIQIWLPRSAELYVERRGHRYYRRHTFTNFKVFSVDTTESVQAPREAYTFTNLSDQDIAGILTVMPEVGTKHSAVTLRFTVPARGRVFKLVGPGKDVNLPVTEVASATFTYDGKDGAIKVDAGLAKETTLDVIPQTSLQ